jgi:hypothetical protein
MITDDSVCRDAPPLNRLAICHFHLHLPTLYISPKALPQLMRQC